MEIYGKYRYGALTYLRRALFPMNNLVALALKPKNGRGTPVASRA